MVAHVCARHVFDEIPEAALSDVEVKYVTCLDVFRDGNHPSGGYGNGAGGLVGSASQRRENAKKILSEAFLTSLDPRAWVDS